MNVFVEEKTLNDSDFDEIDEFSSIKKELQVFCGTADSTLQLCVLSKEYGLIMDLFISEIVLSNGSQLKKDIGFILDGPKDQIERRW